MVACLRLLEWVSLALVLVLLLRRPARRWFGAGPAFTLWALPLLLAVGACLPRWTPITALPLPRMAPGAAAFRLALPTTPTHDALLLATLVWLAGAALLLIRLAWHYRQLVGGCRPLPPALRDTLANELGGVDPRRVYLHSAGPAVLWAPGRTRLLLPADVLQRYPACERLLVLRHEQAHLQRHDALWSVWAEIVHALLWFHPLAWLALPRFRLDRELACDERVLRTLPGQRASYARTLLHSTGTACPPVLIPWLDEPQLKERLTMIKNTSVGTWRRHAGLLAIGLLSAGAVLATQPPAPDRPAAVSASSYRDAPAYPPASIQNAEQGTVILTVQVGADGHPVSATYDAAHSTTASASLIAAAGNAAMRWQFEPAIKDGKPVTSYVRVPVKFDMSMQPGAAPATDGHDKG